jgi:3-hydroxyisobutyrate dehydrogenase
MPTNGGTRDSQRDNQQDGRPAGHADHQPVGVIGLGSMGTAMAARLLDRGFEVTVWNRTASRCDAVAAQGAVPVSSPAEVAAAARIVLVSVADERAVEDVLLSSSDTLTALRPGSVIIETSTVSPEFARALCTRLESAGHPMLEARLLGNARHARQGELRIMTAGPQAVSEAASPLLAELGKEVTYFGDVGAATVMKLVLNMIMGIEIQALAEAVFLGEQAGLPRSRVLSSIAASGFSSPVMRFKCQAMGRGAFSPPDFRLSLMQKDMALALAQAQRLNVPIRTADATCAAFTEAVEMGLGDLDCAAMLSYIEAVSGQKPATATQD